MAMHVIWGQTERSSSSDSLAGSTNEWSRESHHQEYTPHQRNRKFLPPDVREYLDSIVFLNEESGTSVTEQLNSTSEDVDEPKRSLSEVKEDSLARPRTSPKAAELPRRGPLQEVSANSCDRLPDHENLIHSKVRETGYLADQAGSDSENVDEGGGDSEDELQDEIAPAELSKGSQLHGIGKCKPCHYVMSKLGCFNGADCEFCHVSHVKKSRPRPCKKKRLQCKRIMDMLDEVREQNPQELQTAVTSLGNKSAYLNRILNRRIRNRSAGSSQSTPHGLAQGVSPEGASEGASD